jgi:hypothetical protein
MCNWVFLMVWTWFDVKFYAKLKNWNSNPKPREPKNGICSSWNFYKSCDLSIDQKFYAELKKVYIMESEMQPLCYVLWIESLLAGTQHNFSW